MSLNNYMANRFGVRVTHLPTGITAKCDGSVAKTVEQAEDKARRVLKARVAASGSIRPEPIIMQPENLLNDLIEDKL